MSNTVQKPDANPIVSVLLTAFVLHTGHWFINGQQRKWMFITIAWVIGSILCCLPGVVVAILSIIDSYKTAERLKNGETIGENEYTNPMLHKIVSYIDKTATCNAAQ
jgi:hypothetical protein